MDFRNATDVAYFIEDGGYYLGVNFGFLNLIFSGQLFII